MFRASLKRLSSELQTKVEQKLANAFPKASIRVADTSGGCGSAFDIEVIDTQFEGMREINRQRVVNKAIKIEMMEIHSVRVQTKTSL